jgi:ABC-2 type transport system permease protein
MSRLLRIAGREYAAYVRTFGFWLSMGLMPVGLIAAIAAPMLMEHNTPPPHVTVIDLSGRDYGPRLSAALGHTDPSGKPFAKISASPVAGRDTAALAVALRPYLSGDETLAGGGKLDAAVILRPDGDGVAADVWSRNPSDHAVEQKVGGALGDLLRQDRLVKAGIDPGTLKAIDALSPKITAYSPKAAGGRIGDRELAQTFVGFGMGVLLWMVVLTGAGILLNSVIEEKSSRILEVLLTSASVPEIMAGKILGVAAVTSTVLGVWLSIGAAILFRLQPHMFGVLITVLLAKGLLFYFALYFVGGYLMYATLFTTIGAFCETTREAQTLLGPLMMLLTIPMVFMSQAMVHPDAPILRILSWIPPFTPFLMAARAASDPPPWQVLGTGVLMALVTGLELAVAGRAFRAGALSNARFEPKLLVASLFRAAD